MGKTNAVKEKLLNAAIILFNKKGFADTSVRDIAAFANANISTISYYFKGKDGLLEQCLISFFEPYLKVLEKCIHTLEEKGARACLIHTIQQIMTFQYQHFQLSRLIWRELSIDKQVVRETLAVYGRKERAYFQHILTTGMENGEFKKIPVVYTSVQLKGMLTAPFVNAIYTSEVWNIYFQERFYIEKYTDQLIQWVDIWLTNKNE